MRGLHFIDWIVCAAYLVGITGIGVFLFSRRQVHQGLSPGRTIQNPARRRQRVLVNNFPVNRLFSGNNLCWLHDREEFPDASVGIDT